MLNTNPEHIHTYDAQGRMTCCTLEEKINSKAEEALRAGEEASALRKYLPDIVSFVLLFAGILFDNFIKPDFFTKYVRLAWYIIAYIPVGLPVLSDAIKSISKGVFFSEFFLMSIATIGAFAIREYPEGVAVMLFYAVGELFQEAAIGKAKRSIKKLLDIRPDKATVMRNGKLFEVSPDEIMTGEIIELKSGEKVALDGILLSEKASFNTAALTGESKPDTKYKGEEVLAGMINLNTVAEIKITKLFNDTKLSHILNLVQEATERKAKTQLFISRFAKAYTPIVVFLAIALALLPYFFVTNYILSDWLYRALVFLVASCPCALVISIPLGYFGGIGAASSNGILFKGSNYLDIMKRVDTVVMDKTGTLTKGVFKVQKITVKDFDEKLFIKLTAALENKSNHPIASAITDYAGESFKNVTVQEVEEIAGYGLKGKVDGMLILAGNNKLLDEHGISYSADPNDLQNTVIMVAINNQYKGFISIADELKEDAKKTINMLHKLKIKTVMLSGDKNAITKNIAFGLGIDEASGELLPEGKVAELKQYLGADKKVAFVGDGVNDAPVLALADVGIAMGGLGSDAAIETADIIIQTDQPSKIPVAILIAKQTSHIVWQNIFFSMLVKVIVLVLGAGGIATIWEAVFADVGVALIAILNVVRIQRMKFILPLLFLLFSISGFAQENPPLTLDDAIRIALQNNPQVKSSTLAVDQQKALKKTSFSLPKTNFSVTSGQINTPARDNYYGITQDINFPSVYFRQNQVQNQNITLSDKNLLITQNELIKNVRSAYYQLAYTDELLKLLSYQDSVYKSFSEKAELKYQTGESSYLELLAAQNKYAEVQLQKKEAESQKAVYTQEMQKLLNITYTVSFVYTQFEKLPLTIITDTTGISQNPALAYYNQKIVLANSELILEKSRLLPDFSLGYWNQSIDGVKGFQGIELGIGIPIFFGGQQGKVQSAAIQTQIAQSDYENFQNSLKTLFDQDVQEYQTLLNELKYYEDTGLKQADEILKVAILAYQKGEIGYVEYIQNLTQAVTIRTQYLQTVNQLNQTVISINYLTGK